MLYHENMLLGILGAVVGLPLGYAITAMLIGLYDNDLYRLPFHIENRTFVIAPLLTVGFVLLANLAVRRKVMKLDLIEVLKARE